MQSERTAGTKMAVCAYRRFAIRLPREALATLSKQPTHAFCTSDGIVWLFSVGLIACWVSARPDQECCVRRNLPVGVFFATAPVGNVRKLNLTSGQKAQQNLETLHAGENRFLIHNLFGSVF